MIKCCWCDKHLKEDYCFDEFGRPICKLCWKKQDLKDQRDWEDDPVTDESEE